MNAYDIGAIFFAVVFAFNFYRLGLIVALNSFFSFLIAVLLSSFLLNPLLDLLLKLNWRENVFTPFIVFSVLVIVLWGVLLTLLSNFLPFGGRSTVARMFTIPISFCYAILVWVFIWNLIPQFIGNQNLFEAVNNSVIRNQINNFVVIRNLRERFLNELQPKYARSVILSKSDNRVIVLDTDFKVAVYSKYDTDKLYRLISEERERAGVAELARDPVLDKLAYDYAYEIIHSKYFSHLDRNGRMPRERAQKEGISFNYIGENLAIATTVEQANNGLIGSSTHRENIDSGIFRKIGLAVVDLGLDGKLIVEEFTN